MKTDQLAGRGFWCVVLLSVACTTGTAASRKRDAAEHAERLAPVEVTMLRAVLDSLMQPLESTAAVCLQLLGGPGGAEEPSDELLRDLAPQRPVVSTSACPRTYENMIVVIDSTGRPLGAPRPAGYIDPYQFTLGRPQFERRGVARVHARRVQGTRGRDYLCVARQHAERTTAACRLQRAWLHE